MPHAAREIRFYDYAARRQVVVPKGAELPAEAMLKNRCDLEKLARTGYIETEPIGAVAPRRRGRPRKGG